MSSTSPADVVRKPQRSGRNETRPSNTTVLAEQQSGDPVVVAARAGDHLAIHKFLLDVFHGPTPAEFTAQLENPFYEPSDRLIAKYRKQIIGHVRIQQQQMHFGANLLPISNLCELATAPEYRQRAIGSSLLQTAERQMVDEGSLLGVLETNVPEFYRQHGWTVSSRYSFSTADARNILSSLSAQEVPHKPTAISPTSEETSKQYNIRLWRHVEQEALIHLYQENTHNGYGALHRTEDYWQWLFSRRGFDRIYVAIDGPDKLPLSGSYKSIIGYAAIRGSRILEIITAQGYEHAAFQLVNRACADIIENKDGPISIDAVPGNPLHQFLQSAGGKHHHAESRNGVVTMIKIFDPLKLLENLREEINRRAQAAGMDRPFELGLEIRGKWHQILFTPRGVKLVEGKSGRSHLRCDETVLTQLLLGHLNVQQAVDQKLLQLSTRIAFETVQTIFPQLPLWRPPLDNSPA